MTSDVTPVQRLIRETRMLYSRSTGRLLQVGGTGRGHSWTGSLEDCLSAALSAELSSIEEAEPSDRSRTLPSPDWRTSLTNLPAKTREFNLDNLSLLWQEFETRKKRMDEDARWIEEFKAQIDKLSGGADTYTYQGRPVASYRQNGNLNVSKLEAEQPEVVRRFTRMVAEQKFDRNAFKDQEPELFKAYQAKVWRMEKSAGLSISD